MSTTDDLGTLPVPLLEDGDVVWQQDSAVALQAAATALAPMFAHNGAGLLIACPGGSVASVVTGLAEQFVNWLRKLTTISLELVAIESETTGDVIAPGNGGAIMALIHTGERARYVINAADARDFPVDATLNVKVTMADGSPSSVATAEILEATSGTASGKDEMLVHVGTEPGSALVTVFDPANETTIFGSAAIDVAAGLVTHITLSEPTIEPEPVP